MRPLTLNCNYRKCKKPLSYKKLRRHAKYCNRKCYDAERYEIRRERLNIYHSEILQRAKTFMDLNQTKTSFLKNYLQIQVYKDEPIKKVYHILDQYYDMIDNNLRPGILRILCDQVPGLEELINMRGEWKDGKTN